MKSPTWTLFQLQCLVLATTLLGFVVNASSLQQQQPANHYQVEEDEAATYPPADPSKVSHTLDGTKPISINTDTNRLMDEDGREVYFHGVNVVVKGHPWYPEREHWTYTTSFSPKDMAELEDLGLNGIRLSMMWPGAEPERDQYNYTYINTVVNISVDAAQYGIYSLLDMHQDVLSQKFCGEGTPLWAAVPGNGTNFPAPLQKTPYKLSSDGVPTGDQCADHGWAEYYPTEAASTAFQNIYDNFDGLRDKWTDVWKTIASAVQGTGSAILGFELLNEPWAGDIYKDIELMLPTVADKKNLQPMYDLAAAKIRTVDSSHSIFFEGVTWDWFKVGFSHVPGGQQYANLSALSYHFYIPPDFSLPIQFDARKEDMERLHCGGMLTEFALQKCSGCGDVQTQTVMDACDAYGQSWLVWEYKPFVGNRTGWSQSVWFPNGTEDTAVATKLARTYARVVAGVTTRSLYNYTTHIYKLNYRTSASVRSGTTKIYLSERLHYPNGFKVEALSDDPSVVVTWKKVSRNHLQVVHDVQTTPSNTNISVAIWPL